MGLEDVPFYRRMLGDLAKGRPDLSYKFKPSSAPLSGDPQPGSPAAAEAAQSQSSPEPIDITYTDGTILPGRPTHPFEIRVMLNADGYATAIRCYKGLIYDPAASTSSSVKSLIVTNNVVTKRVNLKGGRGSSSGFIEGEQRDFVPTNYDGSGPELHKYVDFQDPIQTTWLPHYRYTGGGGGTSNKSAGRDSDPVMVNVISPTKSFPIGKDSLTEGSNDDAYFEWPYSDDSYIKLYCYDDGDPENRKWALYLNGTLTDEELGQNGFQIFIGSVDGTQVTQHFKSDIVVPNAGPSSTEACEHPFQFHPRTVLGDGSGEGDLYRAKVCAGMVNNLVPLDEPGGLQLPAMIDLLSNIDTKIYLRVGVKNHTTNTPIFPVSDITDVHYPTIVQYETTAPQPVDNDEYCYILMGVARNMGDPENFVIDQIISGSVWVERLKIGTRTAVYYWAGV